MAEERPDYDVVGSGLISEGERIVSPSLGDLIGINFLHVPHNAVYELTT